MRIPTFKAAGRFLGEFELPCLLAKVKNSKLPGIASRHIAIYKTDPICEVYLRRKDLQKPSSWEQTRLEEMFEKEQLGSTIETVMKQYAKSPEAYEDASPQERKQIQKGGIAPFMTVFMMVIDEVDKTVILRARTECDGNLIEHGISLFLRNGRWRFGDSDSFAEYAEQFGGGRDEMQHELASRQWARLFPASETGPLVETGSGFLQGKWVLDGRETKKVLHKLGYPAPRIADSLSINGRGTLEFSSSTARYCMFGCVALWEQRLLGCQRQGNRIYLRCQGSPAIRLFWFDGTRLVDSGGIVYRRSKETQ